MMTTNTEIMYWQKNEDWYRINREKDCFELTERAPERARRSFELYKEFQVRYKELTEQ